MDAASVFAGTKYPCFTLDNELKIIDKNAAAEDFPCTPMIFADTLTQSELDRLSQGLPVQMPWNSPQQTMSSMHIFPVKAGYLALLQPGTVDRTTVFHTQEQIMYELQAMLAALPAIQFYMENPNGENLVNQVTRQAYRILRSTNDQKWAHLLSAGHIPHTDILTLNELLDAQCQAIGMRYPHIRFHFDCPSQPVYVYANNELLELALAHLLHNSLTFAGDAPVIELSVQLTEDRAIVHILDNGKGMQPQVAAHAFEPYFSCDPYCDTSVKPGEGLGLYLVHRSILAMGGECALESEFGSGTRISFSLLLAPTPPSMVRSYLKGYLADRMSCINLVFGPEIVSSLAPD